MIMFGVSDSLEAILGAEMALLVLVLSAIDFIQLKYLEKRISPVNHRLRRLEDAMIATDGGKDEDDDC